MSFYPHGAVVMQRTFTFPELARDAVKELGDFQSYCLAGLAYGTNIECSENPLLSNRYGRVMLRLDEQTRKHFSACIMRERFIRAEKQSACQRGVPLWWTRADSLASQIDMLVQKQ